MDYLWTAVATLFVTVVTTVPLYAAYRVWNAIDEEDNGCCSSCDGQICRPEMCDFAACDIDDLVLKPDLGGEGA